MAWTCETCPERAPCMASVMEKRQGPNGKFEGFYVGGTFARPRCEDHAPRHIVRVPRDEHPVRLAILNMVESAPKALCVRDFCVGLGRKPTKSTQAVVDWHIQRLVARGILHFRRDRDAPHTRYYWLSPVPDEHLPELMRIRRQLHEIADLTRDGLSARAISRQLGIDVHTITKYRSQARQVGLLPPLE